MATISYSVTVRDIDGAALQSAAVKVFDNSGTVIVSGSTDSSGVLSGTVSSTDATPANWKVTATKSQYFKAAGYMIFTDGTTCEQNFYLLEDPDFISGTTGTATSATTAELDTLAAVTAGTVSASKALVVDANKDLASLRDVTLRNLALTGGTREKVTAVTAAGSAQGDAAACSEGINVVTASDGTKGVKLPTPVAGARCLVVNTVSAQNLKVYPNGGTDGIDYGTLGAAVTLAGRKHQLFFASSATQWYSVLTA